MELEVQEHQHHVYYEGMIRYQTCETESIAPGSGQHVEELVTTFVEILASYTNTPFIDSLSLTIFDPPSTRYFDAYSSYNLPPGSTTTQSFGAHSSSFGFLEGPGNLYFSTNLVVDTVGSYPL